ncbi:heavy metal-binding domain-containing protein [Rufibacter roseus]|uniref:Heavy metal-binding domain-containing protein n=1 Tax=Rufibacter roseus TaxID=1567108 RepID=A0ABW2DF27_9BACT|nr:heavy metal-binding domain-containing protein [Rufibacter roseus]
MKKNLLVAIAAFGIFAFSTGCSTASEQDKADATHAQHDAATEQMAYICPMKCEGSASMEPGKCPVCGMDLEKNPDYTAAVADSTAAQQ